jgi:hypothetical protein
MKQIFLLLILFLSGRAIAQVPCDQLLKTAETEFENGNYDQVVSLLSQQYDECHLGRPDRQRAIELLIRTQIEKENPEKADSLVRRLYRLNPNYELVNPGSVNRFNAAIRKYEASPLLTFGIFGGITTSFFHIQSVYSILEGGDYARDYTSRPGLYAGLHLEGEFFRNASVFIDPAYAQVSYSREITGPNNWNLKYNETMSFSETTVGLRYTVPLKNIRLFANAGYLFGRLRSARADVELDYFAYNPIANTYDPFTTAANKIDLMEKNQREDKISEWVFGIGAGYKTGNVIFSLRADYIWSDANVVDTENRYSNNLLTFDYYFIDNDFDLNRLNVSAGINYILMYNIRRK